MSSQILNLMVPSITVIFFIMNIQAKTQQLYKLNLTEPPKSERNEVAKIYNVGEPSEGLVVEGVRSVYVPNDSNSLYEETTTYKADKNGYQANYKLRLINFSDRLGAITLKVITG